MWEGRAFWCCSSSAARESNLLCVMLAAYTPECAYEANSTICFHAAPSPVRADPVLTSNR